MILRIRPITLSVALLASLAAAAPIGAQDAPKIDPSRGVDARVNYPELTRFGPWDDRNYALTMEDLALLSPIEEKLVVPIPAFFRVELRKELPASSLSGPVQYPRASVPLFRIRHGGLMRDGKIAGLEERRAKALEVPVNSEVQLNTIMDRDEVTVEINPIFPDRVIAGSNGSFAGQEMYFSTDGGLTWTVQGNLPSTCCDPTVGWSSDGTVAYAASLGDFPGLSVNFYRSTDFGATWSAPVFVTPSGSDKEFLHVDVSPTSPFRDNIYVSYHNGNVMQLARSTDRGLSFQAQGFSGSPRGIGSDVTSDPSGAVYHFYPSLEGAGSRILLLKSTDGGATFAAARTVSPLNDEFDFAIPAMETRRAFIYVSTDADHSGGAFHGRVYATWTDTTGPENVSSPAANHARIVVGRSTDAGATWQTSIPHPTSDENEVDRFHPWLDVDENGTVHIGFYDTRNSVARSGVDFYYTFSQDGGVTWNQLTRVSGATSANLTDGQEWGDYNGLSVFAGRVIPVWTDNRGGPPNNKNVIAADVVNVTAEPGFLLGLDPTSAEICRPGSTAPIAIEIGTTLGYTGMVTLTAEDLPAGTTAAFNPNPVPAPGQTQLVLTASDQAPASEVQVRVHGSDGNGVERDAFLAFAVRDVPPPAPVLVSPADGDPMAGFPDVTLTWSAAAGAGSYRVQVDESPAFETPLADATVSATNFVAEGLVLETAYFWRVASVNACGPGPFSTIRSFVAGGNDPCEGAAQVFLSTPVQGTTVGATQDGPANDCAFSGADVWFRFTAPYTATFTFSLCGISAYDTAISVFTACGGIQVACNDDFCGLQSQVQANIPAGETRFVRVGGFSGSTGPFQLTVTDPNNPNPTPSPSATATPSPTPSPSPSVSPSPTPSPTGPSETPSPTPSPAPTGTGTPQPTSSPSPSPSPSPAITGTPAATSSPTPSPSPTPDPSPAGALANISTRGFVGTGSQVMIAGIIVGGSGTKEVLISGIGPDLANFQVPGFLPDPVLTLVSNGQTIATNDNWQSASNAAAIQATGRAPNHPAEAAILMSLEPGEYTAILAGAGATPTGVALVQAFDEGGDARVLNISTRGFVGLNERVMIGGFTIGGGVARRVVVRGLGPTIGAPPFNVPGALADPRLRVFSGQTEIATNDDWQTDPNAGVLQSLGLAPPNAAEPALVLTLDPGAYTAVVEAADGTSSGAALVEIYEAD